MSKKIISVLLAVVMIFAMASVAMVSASAFGPLPEKPENTYRYYFYMPEQFINDFAYTAGIYWWEGTGAHDSWPGIEALEGDVEGVYYYDVPDDVTSIVWSNFIDGGMDKNLDIYHAACQTKNIGVEFYEPGESPLYPDGTENFDNMIYVLDFANTDVNDYSGKKTYIGEWYYYYGNGEYGTAANKADAETVYTDRVFNENLFVYGDPTDASTPAASQGTTTEATTAAPVERFGTVVGGTQYLTTVGDVITYTAKLTTPTAIENVQATVTYDAEKLELIDAKSAMFPNLNSGLIYNTGIPGTVKFNASEVMEGFDFTSGATLVTMQFKVLDNSADSQISIALEEMVELMGDDIVSGGEILGDITLVEELTGNTVPTEPTKPVESTPAGSTPAGTTVAGTTGTGSTDATGSTSPNNGGNGTVATGAVTFIYVAIAVLTMAALAVAVLRKRANG